MRSSVALCPWLVLLSVVAAAEPAALGPASSPVGHDPAVGHDPETDDAQRLVVPGAIQRVVGGEPAPEGAWPEAAAVYSPDFFACSGVLIAPDAVLTAGHCGWNVDHVVLGTVDHEAGGEVIDIVDVAVHPDAFSTYDVALLRLAHAAQTPPAVIAPPCVVDDHLLAGAPVSIVGFGATTESAQLWGSTLHQASATIVDPACTTEGAGCNADVSPGGELIAGGDGVDSCSGDSGGPLYLDVAGGPWLVGTTSRAALPSTRPCGDGGVYVRLDAVLGWIEGVLGEPLPMGDCDGLNRPPRLTVEPLRLAPHARAEVLLTVDDPNPGDTHRFTLVEAPTLGLAHLDDDGRLTYRAGGVAGADLLRVRVEDDGDPPQHAFVDVPVQVAWSPGEPSRGCATGPRGSLALALLPLLLLAGRRR